MFPSNNILNTKTISTLIAASTVSVLALGASAPVASAACTKGIQISPVAPVAQSDGLWAAQDQQTATAKVSVCDLSSAPAVQLMKYNGTWTKVSDLTPARSADGNYTVSTGALTGSEEGATYRVTASAEDYTAIKALKVTKSAPVTGGGTPDPTPAPQPTPAPVVVQVPGPSTTVTVEKPVPVETPAKANTPKKPKTPASKVCKGKVTSLYWQAEHRKAARGMITIKGRTAKVAKAWRAVYRGVVKGCKPGTILSVHAMTPQGKVEKTGLKVRKGGRFTGFTEMNATDRTVVVKGKNSKSLYFDRLGS